MGVQFAARNGRALRRGLMSGVSLAVMFLFSILGQTDDLVAGGGLMARAFTAFNTTNLLLVATVVQLPKIFFSLWK